MTVLHSDVRSMIHCDISWECRLNRDRDRCKSQESDIRQPGKLQIDQCKMQTVG